MKRQIVDVRENWEEKAKEIGFEFAHMYGEPYWNEGVVYEFSMDEVDYIEDTSDELHSMCLDVIPDILASEKTLEEFQIPETFWDYLKKSWDTEKDRDIYGRFDLVYDGVNPAKMLEYNADTPTSLYEASAYQWEYLEDANQQGILVGDVDQFNSIHESLIECFRKKFNVGQYLYFSANSDDIEEYSTVEYMGFCAKDAGLIPMFVNIEDVSLSTENQFVTPDGDEITDMFMLYPWEDIMLDDYAEHVLKCNTKFYEPAWKALLSNKAILVELWKKFENHPNLLPAFHMGNTGNDKTKSSKWIEKPVFSREGSSIFLWENGERSELSKCMDYVENNSVIQSFIDIPNFDNNYPILGTWVVDGKCCGMGIREDNDIVTQDLSRFTPHVIV